MVITFPPVRLHSYPSGPVMIGLVNKPCMSNYCRSNLCQLKCVRLPGIIGAISAIIIEYIISVFTPLRYLESENHLFLTHYFIHEILQLHICKFCRLVSPDLYYPIFLCTNTFRTQLQFQGLIF